jgi:hypothetical protein
MDRAFVEDVVGRGATRAGVRLLIGAQSSEEVAALKSFIFCGTRRTVL